MIASDVTKTAAYLGACGKSSSVSDWKSLVWLFFSAQGREFCKGKNYPPLAMFQEMKQGVEPYGVFVDAGTVEKVNIPNVGVIGETDAKLTYTDNTKVHKVIVMHGGKVEINASNYVVILVENIGGELIVNKDETVKIL